VIEMQDHVLPKCSTKFKIKIISQTIETILKTKYKKNITYATAPHSSIQPYARNLKVRKAWQMPHLSNQPYARNAKGRGMWHMPHPSNKPYIRKIRS